MISDAQHRVTFIDSRHPGSINDAYIFKKSRVNRRGVRNAYGDFFLLANSG